MDETRNSHGSCNTDPLDGREKTRDTVRVKPASDTICLADLEFLMRTELLRASPDENKRDLIQALERVELSAGARLITQGEPGDRLYVIQKGSCIRSLEKNGRIHRISRLKAGDIVGEMAVLTGEPRSANVDSETEMILWALPGEAFDRISESRPDLRRFLTEVSTERLCSQKITAERKIGKYTIHEIVAEGGWSIVYKGIHSFLNLPVAIKMLKHSMAEDSDFFERFQNEAKFIAGLNHENIVRVYDIEHMYTTVFIMMEYLEGLTVKHILENRPGLPVERLLRIIIQVCHGLDYAHRQGIVHQDVKPGNIFIQPDDRVKLVDFGLATPIGCASDDMPGTPFYMAPEQIEGDPVDPRTDIYSLGITAYEMATGQRPFPDDICTVLKAHITEEISDPRAIVPNLPEEFTEFVRRATSKNPNARYRNIGEVLDILVPMARRFGAEPRAAVTKRRKLMSLLMLYDESRQVELRGLLQDFGRRINKLGAELRLADYDDFEP
jgi:serine/threonine protein kinase